MPKLKLDNFVNTTSYGRGLRFLEQSYSTYYEPRATGWWIVFVSIDTDIDPFIGPRHDRFADPDYAQLAQRPAFEVHPIVRAYFDKSLGLLKVGQSYGPIATDRQVQSQRTLRDDLVAIRESMNGEVIPTDESAEINRILAQPQTGSRIAPCGLPEWTG